MKNIPPPTQNTLFAAMSIEAQKRLLPHLNLVALTRDKILYSPDTQLREIYFPIDAIVALIYMVESGSSSEISVVGNEGLVGIFALLSHESTSNQAMVLSSGYAYAIPVQYMQEEFKCNSDTMQLLLKYVQALFSQMSQTAVCNRHHSIDQQLCRLLLLSLDRLPCNNLTMTHDLISRMLGVRRGGITEAAFKLQQAGVIDYHRGHIKVLDREKLEELSCECYAVVKRETDRLLPRKSPIAFELRPLHYRTPMGTDPKCAHCFKFSSCVYLKKPALKI